MGKKTQWETLNFSAESLMPADTATAGCAAPLRLLCPPDAGGAEPLPIPAEYTCKALVSLA